MINYQQRKNDTRPFLMERLNEYIQFIGIDKFLRLEPEELLDGYMVFARNALRISLHHKKNLGTSEESNR